MRAERLGVRWQQTPPFARSRAIITFTAIAKSRRLLRLFHFSRMGWRRKAVAAATAIQGLRLCRRILTDWNKGLVSMMRYRLSVLGALGFFGILWLGFAAQPPVPSPESDAMLRGFSNPPNSARPRVWWHWMNGNITPEGIQLDLHWMSRVGLGGFTVFEGAIDTPQVVKQRLIYMTPPWKEAFSQAVSTARRSRAGGFHRQLPGMERNRRTMGSSRAGHEEASLERHARGGWRSVHRNSASATEYHRNISELQRAESPAKRCRWRPGCSSPAAVLY